MPEQQVTGATGSSTESIEEQRDQRPGARPHLDEQSTTALVAGVITDAKHLITAELESMKIEMKEELSRAKSAVAAAAVGGAVLAMGGLLLMLMLVWGLSAGTSLPLWATHGLVGGVLAIVGIALLLIGRNQITGKDADLWPGESVEEIKKDVAWVKDRVRARNH